MEDVIILGIVGLLVALLLTIFSLLWYSGVFASVDVGTGKPPFGKLKLAYKFATGPYKECASLFTELVKLTPDIKTCGIYYDDPNEVEHSKLRYIVAGVLAEGDSKVDKDTEKKLLDNGFKPFEIPNVDFVVHATFPYVWDISFYIAVTKVYPRLGEYIKERQLSAHPAVEFYDPATIHFVMPLSKQEAFYVPEAAYAEESAEESTEEPGTKKTKSPEETDKQAREGDNSEKGASSADEKKKEESGEDSSSSFEQVDAPK